MKIKIKLKTYNYSPCLFPTEIVPISSKVNLYIHHYFIRGDLLCSN